MNNKATGIVINVFAGLFIGFMLAMVIMAAIVPSKSELIDDAMKDGRWEQYLDCSEDGGDAVCEECWNIYIAQKKQ